MASKKKSKTTAAANIRQRKRNKRKRGSRKYQRKLMTKGIESELALISMKIRHGESAKVEAKAKIAYQGSESGQLKSVAKAKWQNSMA